MKKGKKRGKKETFYVGIVFFIGERYGAYLLYILLHYERAFESRKKGSKKKFFQLFRVGKGLRGKKEGKRVMSLFICERV